MKDYTLSEIRCGMVSEEEQSEQFALLEITRILRGRNIELRDMLDLPCVVHNDDKDFYQIFWRKKDGLIGYELKCTKAEADEFLAGLKENK